MATACAAASHLAAGGHVPPVLLVLLSLALSGPVCMALAGRVLSRSSLLTGVLVSQGVFHLLFSIAGSVTTVADATHHAALSSPSIGPALVLQAQAQAHAVNGGTGMLVFHVVAAAATYGFLRHGEADILLASRAADAVARSPRRLEAPCESHHHHHRPRPGVRPGPARIYRQYRGSSRRSILRISRCRKRNQRLGGGRVDAV